MGKAKRTYQIDQDVIESFDEWQRRTRLKPSDATQLGIYLLMQLTAEQREKLIGRMDARESVDLMGLFGEDGHSVSTYPTDSHTDPVRRTRDVLETAGRPRTHGKRA